MSVYTCFGGNDGKWYWKEENDGTNTTPPTVSVSSSFATMALALAAMQADVMAKTGFNPNIPF
jgi:hypothetical protein